MELQALTAISPIDGRYRNQVAHLAEYFSEYALIKYRVHVEIEYIIALSEAKLKGFKPFTPAQIKNIRKIVANFSLENALEIKNIEKTTNHDVKAVEYFIKACFDQLKIKDQKEFIHFALTSQDINNTSIPLSLKESVEKEILPLLTQVMSELDRLATSWKEIPMLAHTHGQPASPTRLGKEIQVFHERLTVQYNYLKSIPYSAKFGGATGNFNAHHVAYPKTNWVKFADQFVNKTLGLKRSKYTTQIEHYDNIAALCDAFKRINNILLDLDRDVWQYISMGYFKQKIKKGEVGSSAMPHKVNPIDFENSEGNIGIANALFEHFSAKLPISRLQRDLTDSTVLRNIGIPFSHSVIAYKSLLKGLGKLELNEAALQQDLEDNWAVVAEAIQTILRREGYPNPYEKLKDLTRTNTNITEESIVDFIVALDVTEDIKNELMQITPHNYTGILF
jgi:adenylosuccinate lyase